MREYVIKRVDTDGTVQWLDPRGLWRDCIWKAKLYSKGHATRTANTYRKMRAGTITAEVQS